MKIFFEIYKYRLPYAITPVLKGKALTCREGLFLKLTDTQNHFGWGEIAPLEGFSRENLNEAISQINNLYYNLNGTELPDNLEDLSGGFERWLGKYHLAPSVQCGLETAVLNLLAASHHMPLHRLLSEQSRTVVKVNALLNGKYDDIITRAQNLAAHGYEAAKLKVGGKPVKDDIRLTEAVRENIGDNISLRLDANRAWDFDDALEFGHEVKKCNIEYIEEPLCDPSKLKTFYNRTGVNFALDESLLEITPGLLEYQPGLTALILKPTFLGGFETTMRYIRKARQLGLKSVISSAHESPIGITALASLAAAIDSEDIPHGLDTLIFFKDEQHLSPIKISGGIIDLCSLVTPPDIEMVHLTEIKN